MESTLLVKLRSPFPNTSPRSPPASPIIVMPTRHLGEEKLSESIAIRIKSN